MLRPFSDAQFPARPYPGARPDCSFVHLDGAGRALRPEAGSWLVDDLDLDPWLVAQGVPPLADRWAVLAYGSNACPAKITWLRESLGLTGPVIVLRARCTGLSAVWAAGFRVVDEQRPATLAALPAAVEDHAIWLATSEQIGVLDVCEGRGTRYDLARVRTGSVVLESGVVVADPLAYVGRAGIRMPLLVDGRMVRCVDVGQADAMALTGVPATTDGLDRAPVAAPRP